MKCSIQLCQLEPSYKHSRVKAEAASRVDTARVGWHVVEHVSEQKGADDDADELGHKRRFVTLELPKVTLGAEVYLTKEGGVVR